MLHFRISHMVFLPTETPPCPLLSAVSANTPAPAPAVFSTPRLWLSVAIRAHPGAQTPTQTRDTH